MREKCTKQLKRNWRQGNAPQCLKITKKVSFNIASEASYVYILIKQKFIENVKSAQFWRVFDKLKLVGKQCYIPDRSILIGQQLVVNAKIETFWLIFTV